MLYHPGVLYKNSRTPATSLLLQSSLLIVIVNSSALLQYFAYSRDSSLLTVMVELDSMNTVLILCLENLAFFICKINITILNTVPRKQILSVYSILH